MIYQKKLWIINIETMQKNFVMKRSQNSILKKKLFFKKNQRESNDIFFSPIDISDNTIPNGNAMMLINLLRLGMMNEAKALSSSLNGYLNIYKSHMMTTVRAIDYYNNINSGKNCNEQGCIIASKWIYKVAVILSVLFIIIKKTRIKRLAKKYFKK